jgi:hypothetical protein
MTSSLSAMRSSPRGGELLEDLVDRPWGLQDFRLLDPDRYLLRYTSR